MTDAELLAYHAKAVSDTNDLLEHCGLVWLSCNEALRSEAAKRWPSEVLTLLGRLRESANAAIRKAMQPPTPEGKR